MAGAAESNLKVGSVNLSCPVQLRPLQFASRNASGESLGVERPHARWRKADDARAGRFPSRAAPLLNDQEELKRIPKAFSISCCRQDAIWQPKARA
jgi:hypothetical protein